MGLQSAVTTSVFCPPGGALTVAVGQPTEGFPSIWKWNPETAGFCHAHPTVLTVLFLMICVAMQVLAF